MLCPPHIFFGVLGLRQEASALLAALGIEVGGVSCQVGKTKVFFRREAVESLERSRAKVVDSIVVLLQAAGRGWLAAREYKAIRLSAAFIQRAARGAAARRAARRARAGRLLCAVGRAAVARRKVSHGLQLQPLL